MGCQLAQMELRQEEDHRLPAASALYLFSAAMTPVMWLVDRNPRNPEEEARSDACGGDGALEMVDPESQTAAAFQPAT